ncbi:hypothetical protein AU252_13065 [Pseudarthrobacter sulfonivorans]|uniref:Uncharacterized protein n=1 Tax=Pseudarthrobacter sulfonivorans TaxID=121292 RepID=A0A0U3GRY5_9MICC|nr:hypothetical protein AU252_13065 [Pseudarthrobacter sulfonivorans]
MVHKAPSDELGRRNKRAKYAVDLMMSIDDSLVVDPADAQRIVEVEDCVATPLEQVLQRSGLQ